MIVNKSLQLFQLSILSIVLTGCGLNFGAGGASLEGTGNGRPPAPGLGNASETQSPVTQYEELPERILSLGASVNDVCNMLSREIQFVDPQDGKVLEKQTDILTDAKDKVSIEVQLSLKNLYTENIMIDYPSCDVPLMLNSTSSETQYFPRRECEVSTTEVIAPNQVRSFKLIYEVDQPLEAEWRVHPKMNIKSDHLSPQICEPLRLTMSMNNKKD